MSDNEGTEVETFIITLAVIIRGNFGVARGTTVNNASAHDWEYVRGAIWNDDPAGLLFNDTTNDNKSCSTAAMWYKDYLLGEYQWQNNDANRLQNVIGRSHYGDLQFLHAMASNLGEPPQETKRKVMTWLEVIYKLANGEDAITKDTTIEKTKLNDLLCPQFAFPQRWKALQFVFARNAAFASPDITRRAFGSIFHIIQDSYAIGHIRRVMLNPEHKISNHPLAFSPNTYDQWGPISNFHTYAGQSSERSTYDHSHDPPPTNLDDVEGFNALLGCCMAVEKCEAFMKLFTAGTKWAEGVSDFLDGEVFALAEGATGANNEVW